MSRSWKNYPFKSSGSSDKFQKRRCNKGLRRNSKSMLHRLSDVEDVSRSTLPVKNEIVDDWSFNRSDGYDVSQDEEYPGPYHFTKSGKLRK